MGVIVLMGAGSYGQLTYQCWIRVLYCCGGDVQWMGEGDRYWKISCTYSVFSIDGSSIGCLLFLQRPLQTDVGGAVPNEIGQRRDWPACGRDQRRSSHPEPIPRDGSQTVTCRRNRPGAQPEERLEDVNLSSLDVLVSRDEQSSAFCLRHNWLTEGSEVEGQSRLLSCDGKRARAGRPRALLMAGKSHPAGSGSAVAISEISVSLEARSRPAEQPWSCRCRGGASAGSGPAQSGRFTWQGSGAALEMLEEQFRMRSVRGEIGQPVAETKEGAATLSPSLGIEARL
ncbi:uncharacterized protein RBU57_016779 [Macrochelys suwanniensis]